MHYLVQKIILMVLGVFLVLFGGRIVRVYLRYYPTEKGRRWTLNVWSIRAVGIAFLVLGILVPSKNPWSWHTMIARDENCIALLENGQITEGQVAKVWYQLGAPEGWRMDYEFDANEPATKVATIYVGSAQGPREYYAQLKPGEPVMVIYYPEDPRINCEVKYFLNCPDNRYVFRKARKFHLLAKFRDKYEVMDYTHEEWYRQQRQK